MAGTYMLIDVPGYGQKISMSLHQGQLIGLQ